jgi:hypothetical protein
MVAFTHLSMVGFLILGLSMVRLLITLAALLHQNTNESKDDDVIWPHSIFCFITFFTIILFWWTSYPLRDISYFPNEGWNLFTFILYLSVPFLFFMVTEVVVPQNNEGNSLDLQDYYYKYHRVILGLAWTLQLCLIGNLFVFFQGELYSLKVLGRVIMLGVMTPMVISDNRKVHEIGMGIFFVGFIYTIIKYHIFMAG